MDVALKEWSVVIAALLRGEQVLLLRKGGIVEARQGFQVRHQRFLLYPSYEHQHADGVRPAFAPLLQTAAEAVRDGSATISAYAEVTDVLAAPTTLKGLQALEPFHIYAESLLRMRLEYRPDLPLQLLVVRCFVLPVPVPIPVRPSYAGCKSWMNLTDDVPVEGANLALSEHAFAEKRNVLLQRLPG